MRMAAVVIGVLLSSVPTFAADTPGQAVYTAAKCSACHSIAGQGNKKGPLDGVGTKLNAAEIREWITRAPDMMVKTKALRKPAMKAYPNLSKVELDALVAFLQTLKT